jgi:gamma-glutamylcyclotransferase (GGCT)/AIG2-like uncharacterized protein YtfP
MLTIDHRLATYGTLAPAQPNHHQLSTLPGIWRKGHVFGHLVQRGWAAAIGYPALVPASDGQQVAVHLFESPELPDHWARLDAFEGAQYRRAAILVQTPTGPLEAWIYLDAAPA